MGDVLLELSKYPTAKKAIRTLGLPLPLPQVLRRATGPWEARPLSGSYVVVGGPDGGRLTQEIATTLARAGADSLVAGAEEMVTVFREASQEHGTGAHRVFANSIAPKPKLAGLVFDATGLSDVAGLERLYEFFHPLATHVRASGRMIVLGLPLDACETPQQAAAQQALDGFMRSLAKEVGKRGTTACLIRVQPDASDRLEGLLRFMLSARSAFITGQTLLVHSRLKSEEQTAWTRPLADKVVMITGAARGIGAATARLMAAEGAHVVCLDRPADEGPLREVADAVGGSALLADISEAGAPDHIAKQLMDKHGRLDVVVHNAGITRDKTLTRMTPDKWNQVLDVNLTAPIRINERLLDGVLRDDGKIVCLSSMAGMAGNVGQTNYTASKAGVIGYVKHLSEQLADRGIAVNAVAPGFIETRMTAAIPVAIRQGGQAPEQSEPRRTSSRRGRGHHVPVDRGFERDDGRGASGLRGIVLGRLVHRFAGSHPRRRVAAIVGSSMEAMLLTTQGQGRTTGWTLGNLAPHRVATLRAWTHSGGQVEHGQTEADNHDNETNHVITECIE